MHTHWIWCFRRDLFNQSGRLGSTRVAVSYNGVGGSNAIDSRGWWDHLPPPLSLLLVALRTCTLVVDLTEVDIHMPNPGRLEHIEQGIWWCSTILWGMVIMFTMSTMSCISHLCIYVKLNPIHIHVVCFSCRKQCHLWICHVIFKIFRIIHLLTLTWAQKFTVTCVTIVTL